MPKVRWLSSNQKPKTLNGEPSMSQKTLIYISIAIFGIIGGWIGSVIDNGSIFGMWGIIGSTLGGLLGIWIGFKLGSNL